MIFELFYSSTCLNIDILLLAVLINAMGVYVEQQHLQNEAVNTEIVCMTHLLKKGICIFSNTANDWQVHLGRLLQIVQLRIYIDYNK